MAESMSVKPFCFMVMPFGRKATQAEPGKGPAEIDFNALWDKAYFPLLQELGYQPVRADQETGSLIINQMLERLYFSDLVLADMTIPNGNVYYEIGLRHAARKEGCVLLAADWSRPLFDVAQMRMVRYPLPKGDLDDELAKTIRDALRPAIDKMKRGASPFYEALPGYPQTVDERTRAGIRDQVEMLAAFQAEMRALREAPPGSRLDLAREAVARHGKTWLPSVKVSLLRALVSGVNKKNEWEEVLAYIAQLDNDALGEAAVREVEALALGKIGKPQDAIAKLLALVASAGDTSERQGLLGGRYKEQMRAAEASRKAFFRNKAIEHYERGMMLDLNDYFPSSNLPRLYRARGQSGDESRAQMALQVTIAACERARRRGSTDEWVRPTLLGAAFDLPDPAKAEELADQIENEGAGGWHLDTTLASIAESVDHVTDAEIKMRLKAVLDRLQAVAAAN
jgi:hypothetical protein